MCVEFRFCFYDSIARVGVPVGTINVGNHKLPLRIVLLGKRFKFDESLVDQVVEFED